MSNESPHPLIALYVGGGIFYSRKILASILGTWLEVEKLTEKLTLNTCVVQIICGTTLPLRRVSRESPAVHNIQPGSQC